ncbi:MAG: ribulose-phosphate 3-epimerase [Candidatus Omnitrophota bacterium]
MKILVAPSILSADFSCLGRELKRAEAAGADMLHIDVMDAHFVPNITVGPAVVKCIRRITRLPLDVHLMIEHPEKFIDAFIAAGSDMITVHIEAVAESKIKCLKLKANAKRVKLGISLNPATPLERIKAALKDVDFVLVMSVNPGFSGQEFIPRALDKIKALRRLYKGDIAIDGGINQETAELAIRAGANILASGSYIFGAKNMLLAIERIRNAGN